MEGPGGIFIPTQPRLHPPKKKPNSSSPESNYWSSSFKTLKLTHPRFASSISAVHFSPQPPHPFVLTSSTSLTVYSSQTLSPKFTISQFTDVARSACFRSDGRLIAAGSDSGDVLVFDAHSKLRLRRLSGHSRPVHFVTYPTAAADDKLHLLSAGDDALVKFWDVAGETPVVTLSGHKDYVRSGAASPAAPGIWATGSYDHTVRIWDVRRPETAAMTLDHGKPVEDVIFLPSGGWMATAGGNTVNIWDVVGGGKLVFSMENHNKTVTALSLGKFSNHQGEESNRIFSVSLDGYLKIFDYSNFRVTHTARYPFPLLSIDNSPSSTIRVVGSANSVAFVSKKKKSAVEILDADGNADSTNTRTRRSRYFERGQGEKPSETDVIVKRPPRIKLAKHDQFLKKFHHMEALVSVLKLKDPAATVAVMEELIARKKLLRCISNLGPEDLDVLLGFLHRYTTLPKYASFLMVLARKVIQMREKDILESEVLKKHLKNLRATLAEEIHVQKSLLEIQGIISPLLRMARR